VLRYQKLQFIQFKWKLKTIWQRFQLFSIKVKSHYPVNKSGIKKSNFCMNNNSLSLSEYMKWLSENDATFDEGYFSAHEARYQETIDILDNVAIVAFFMNADITPT